jgi:hypothetical protein
MTEQEFLDYCKNQVNGPLKDEDIILMLTAWGGIKHSLGYNKALDDNDISPDQTSQTNDPQS